MAVVQKYVDRILLGQYAPSGLLVNAALKVVEFRGDTGPYLGPLAGEANLDALHLIREELVVHVKDALDQTRKKKSSVRLDHLEIRQAGEFRTISLTVIPIYAPSVEPHFLILFEEIEKTGEQSPAQEEPVAGKQINTKRHIAHLEQELAATRRYLQSIIEELRSANEEAQSTNEELQSTNEELQTAQEELQSSNEELNTVNAEMQSRNEELGQINDDLINLLSSMNMPILMLGSDLRIRRFTPTAEKVLHLIASDVGRPVSDLKPRINVPNLEEILRGVIQTLAVYEQEVQDQEGRWHLMRVRPYRTADHRIDGAVLQLIDFTELRRSLDEAKGARDFAQAIVDTVREPLVVLNHDLRIRTANRAFYATFHLSPAEAINQTIFEVGRGQWNFPKVHELLDNLAHSAARLEDVELERHFDRIGRKTILLNARRIEEIGNTSLILLAIEDITERKRAEESRYRRLFEASKDGIVVVEAASGAIAEVNPLVEQLCDQRRQQLVGRTLSEIDPFRSVRELERALKQIREQGLVRLDVTLNTNAGRAMQVEIIGNAYTEAGKKLVQLNIRDITERKRLEQQLQHTQKLESLGVLAGGIAHDFNNLLTGILGNASLALAETPIEQPSRNHLREIAHAAERAAHLTGQMLAYAGKGRFVVEPVNLSELIQEIHSLILTSIPKSVEVRLDLMPDLPAVEADVSQMQQVIMNLVINGAEAMEERTGGTVLVRTGVVELTEDQVRGEFADDQVPPGTYVWLEVQDNGSGMDEATKAKIFDPFFTTKFTGRGLGLAALLGIVKGHKGVLRVDSEPGRGSNFRVLFPATMAKRVAAPTEAVGEALRGSGTILVVDDENTVRQLVRAALQRYGYTVLLAEDGAAGIQVLREKAAQIVLVLLDIAMPVTGGEVAIEQFKRIRQDLPVVLMTGYSEAEAAQRFVGKELAGFIQKPFTIQKLLGAVSSATKRAKKAGSVGRVDDH